MHSVAAIKARHCARRVLSTCSTATVRDAPSRRWTTVPVPALYPLYFDSSSTDSRPLAFKSSCIAAQNRGFQTSTVVHDSLRYHSGSNPASALAPDSDRGFGASSPNVSNPRLIAEYLDEFVIGQTHAKRVLAVAVFNHYARVRINFLKKQREAHSHESIMAVPSTSYTPKVAVDLSGLGESTVEPLLPPGLSEKRHPMGTMTFAIPTGHIQDIPLANFDARARSNYSICLPTSSAPPQPQASSPNAESTASLMTLEKSNVLLIGPTGCGKTLLARTLAGALRVPFSHSDATPFTQAGYVGEDVEACITRLLAAADWDVQRAEQGIIFIDEIDKISARRGWDGHGGFKDVGGEGVQQALLRMLEGTMVTVTDKAGNGSAGRKSTAATSAGSGRPETYQVDTSNILFVLSGAFIGLDRIIQDRVSKGSIGFEAKMRPKSDEQEKGEHDAKSKPLTLSSLDTLQLAETNDLIAYGLIPEFIGRLPILAAVHSLSVPDLVRVLQEPRNALLKQYHSLFRLSGVELHFTDKAVERIAAVAVFKRTGARGLRRILETILLTAMFEAPGSDIKHVVVCEESIEHGNRSKASIELGGNGENTVKYFSEKQEGEVEKLMEAQRIASSGENSKDNGARSSDQPLQVSM